VNVEPTEITFKKCLPFAMSLWHPIFIKCS